MRLKPWKARLVSSSSSKSISPLPLELSSLSVWCARFSTEAGMLKRDCGELLLSTSIGEPAARARAPSGS
jgi:hypothetical protein